MSLHILINISADTENFYGVRFLSSFFGEASDIHVTLFHICQAKKSSHSAKLLESWECEDETAEASHRARKALDKARQMLQQFDSSGKTLQVKTIREKFGTAKDILAENTKGLYDAIILGRRATYTLQSFFDRPGDAIPHAIANDKALTSPLWLCHDPEEGRSNVLLCLDGSESAYRAADHVGYILNRAPRHKVTLYHVAMADSDKTTEIFQRGTGIIQSHNIAPERIVTKREWGISIPGAILSEAEEFNYAAVAIGLHHVPQQNLLEQFGIQAPLTATLIKKIIRATLWCVP